MTTGKLNLTMNSQMLRAAVIDAVNANYNVTYLNEYVGDLSVDNDDDSIKTWR